MKSVLLRDIGHVQLTEREIPERKQGEALIRIKTIGICGTDVNGFKGKGTKVNYPLIPGHEATGEIVDIDPGNPKGLQKGDLVIIDPYVYCGNCYPCSIGRTNCCEKLKVLGVHTDGCMSEYVVHPDNLLHKIPDGMSLESAALAEPLTIALHSLHRVSLGKGDKVLIFGAGPIGLLTAMAAIHYGGEPMIVDIVAERLQLARTLGVRHVINPAVQDLSEEVRTITAGRMAEAVVEATGSSACIQNTMTCSSYCGRIALTGWPDRETPLDTFSVTKKELQIFGSRNSKNEFGEAIDLIRKGGVDVNAIVSETIAFSDLPEAIRKIAEFPGKYIKIVGCL